MTTLKAFQCVHILGIEVMYAEQWCVPMYDSRYPNRLIFTKRSDLNFTLNLDTASTVPTVTNESDEEYKMYLPVVTKTLLTSYKYNGL